jgi:hypothetical protein
MDISERVDCDARDSVPCSQFFRNNYTELKMLNPLTPFVYREADDMKPFVYARFGASGIRAVRVASRLHDD